MPAPQDKDPEEPRMNLPPDKSRTSLANISARPSTNEVKVTGNDITSAIMGGFNNLHLAASTCIIHGCGMEQNEAMLRCKLCKLLIHYECTGLPNYQLYQFVYQKGYRNYVCHICTGDIPELVKTDKDSSLCLSQTSEKMHDDFNKRIAALKDEANTMTRDLNESREECKKLKCKNNKMAHTIKSLEDHQKELRLHIVDQDKLLKIRNNVTHATESKSTQVEESVTKADSQIEVLEEIIDAKLNKMENNLKKVFDKKLENILKESKTYAATVTNATDMIKQQREKNNENDLRHIFNETRNEQLANERDMKMRSTNLIVHGLLENVDEGSNLNESDDRFVASLFQVIGVDTPVKKTIRLGKDNVNKKRPLKVVLNSENEKDGIMAKLKNLKNAEERFKKLSITEDYTIEERKEIKEFIEKANLKNAEEENTQHIWKVRGSPKNGLRLVKFTRQ